METTQHRGCYTHVKEESNLRKIIYKTIYFPKCGHASREGLAGPDSLPLSISTAYSPGLDTAAPSEFPHLNTRKKKKKKLARQINNVCVHGDRDRERGD